MIIFHNDGIGMTNMGAVKYIEAYGKTLIAHYVDGTKKFIAQYPTEERAVEVIKGMPKLLNSYTEADYIELPER